ncbi:D-serine dehydratase [Cladorrhinum sp. PSN332]|nr:D-serine dehydratase [Cladorrhinum sp. PSN332]
MSPAEMTTAQLKEQLKREHVGKTLHQVPTPSVVLDLAKVKVHCERMLEAAERLDLLWRPHIKSHKTEELTRLQVGDNKTTLVRLVVSTVIEAENIAPLLKEYQSEGRDVNVLFSFPLLLSAVPRLANLTADLGPNSLSLMIDDPAQLQAVEAITKTPGAHPPLVFIKIDGGYRRAGVIPNTSRCSELIEATLAAEKAGTCILHGLYIHAGYSYGHREDWAALKTLADEFTTLAAVAKEVKSRASPGHPLVLSVGATPTATTIQHPHFLSQNSPAVDPTAKELQELFVKWKTEDRYQLEVHAGVYTTLDLQQLATHARDSTLMKADDIAITVLAEVASTYPNRSPNSTTEILINAGCLSLGREPMADKGKIPGQDYAGWGFVMPWGGAQQNPVPGPDFPTVHDGWQVGRISQEHGILVWHGDDAQNEIPLHYGDRIRIWPNHSCIAGACFDHYLIVDSSLKGREDEVVDVWPRWRGW